MSDKECGNVIYYEMDNNKHTIIKTHIIDDEYIKNINVNSVKSLLTNIKQHVEAYDMSQLEITNVTFAVDDIVYKCVHDSRWRRGSGFLFLQLSDKNGGSLRLTAYTTNTIHHSAICFGTVPQIGEVNDMIKKYMLNKSNLLTTINTLKRYHKTNHSAEKLMREMLY
jgi:hypothetical protein